MPATVTPINSRRRPRQSAVLSILNRRPLPVLLPEDALDFVAFRAAILERFAPYSPEDVVSVLDYVDIVWRLRRVAVVEAELINLEFERTGSSGAGFEGAFSSDALSLLYRAEDVCSRRLASLGPCLERLAKEKRRPEAA
jgi:hypothetical protein